MTLSARFCSAIDQLDPAAWDGLDPQTSTFLSWQWLAALEASACVGPEQGWVPHHLTLWQQDQLVAAAPLYLKSHSRGEFVFDQEWADVSHRLGVPYYPKLLGMSPFTPAGNYRFLIAAHLDKSEIVAEMLGQIDRFCHENQINSVHFLHVDTQWHALMVAQGVGSWLHHGLIWENRDYRDFDHYLAGFNSKHRKNIRRERRLVQDQALVFKVLRGTEVPREYFQLMYFFYAGTCNKFWGWSHYLNQSFFLELARRLPQNIVLIAAYSPNTEVPVAMSFLVQERDWLYGRFWGCREDFDFLHFETCYYQAIDWAIHHGIRYYDAGSGNATHKERRGFPATPKHSLHRFYDPLMNRVWQDNIEFINQMEQQRIDQINRR